MLSIMSSIPFFFLPKSLDKSRKETSLDLLKANEERTQMANVTNHRQNVTENITGKYFAFIVNLELLISVTVDETVS